MLVDNSLHNHRSIENRFKKPVIECEHPVFVVNPSLPELISKYRHYFFNGKEYFCRYKYRRLFDLDKRPFQQLLDTLTSENYLEHFVVNDESGEFYPIYLCVPCGHCHFCHEKKVNSFVQRIKYESFMYPFQPIFVTFTYDDKHLPKDGVSVRDCQLFLKRFRQRLVRSGYIERFRYALVSEYGRRTHRAHYHAIFFGLPVSDDADMRRIESILNLAWGNGFTLARKIDMRDNATSYYTAKYMRKDMPAPNGKSSTFCLSSRGHGGLGSAFFRKQSKMLHKRVQREFDVLNPWTSKTEPFIWSSYSLDKIYPSLNKSIPLQLRKALKQYFLSYAFWKHYNPELCWLFDTNYSLIKSKFKDLLYLPYCMDISELPLKDLDIQQGEIYESERTILKYIDKDFSDAPKIAQQREFLLSNISVDRCDIDLVQKLSRIKRNISRLEKLEVL